LGTIENEVSSIAEVNYSKLDFVQVAGPYVIQVIEKLNRVNVVDQILNQKVCKSPLISCYNPY
jgi:hypothetical protein